MSTFIDYPITLNKESERRRRERKRKRRRISERYFPDELIKYMLSFTSLKTQLNFCSINKHFHKFVIQSKLFLQFVRCLMGNYSCCLPSKMENHMVDQIIYKKHCQKSFCEVSEILDPVCRKIVFVRKFN